MAEPAVVNASPLIFLSRADLIDLLQLVFSEVIVPEAVASEIEVRGDSDPTAQTIANTSWLVVTQTPSIPPQIQAWGLGPGESAVLAWAHTHEGSEAIIDDLAGRRCAAAFNIPVRGTLGLVLTANNVVTFCQRVIFSTNCARLVCICPTGCWTKRWRE